MTDGRICGRASEASGGRLPAPSPSISRMPQRRQLEQKPDGRPVGNIPTSGYCYYQRRLL